MPSPPAAVAKPVAQASPVPSPVPTLATPKYEVEEFPVPAGTRPHDAVPDGLGWVWYAGQGNGEAGALNPATGEIVRVPLAPSGERSALHGVVMGPDGAPWFTDGGLNAIVRVDPTTLEVDIYRLPGPGANLNTPSFDQRGILWFTGQNGYIGWLDPAVGEVHQFDVPRGPGPYGIDTAPDGSVYFASLAGSYLGRIDGDNGEVTVLDPPTRDSGVRRVWADSTGLIWIAQYSARQIARYDPASGEWKEWRVPGANARPYAIYIDHQDKVWISDTGADTIVTFDPVTEEFTTVPISRPSNVAQLGGIPGEVWGAQRARDHVFVVRYQR